MSEEPFGNPWFGEPWPHEFYRALVCADDRLRIAVPVGKPCDLCGEPIIETDRGTAMAGLGADGVFEVMYVHRECSMRNVMGCFDLVSTGAVWTPEHVCSDSGSYRADALKVWDWLQAHPGC